MPVPQEGMKPEATKPERRSRSFISSIITPRRLKWREESPPEFTLLLNFLLAFAACFTVANLYYVQPVLIVLARDFGVSYSSVTNIPTLLQAGYAVGLCFICPCGDLLPRRPLVLSLILCSTVLTLALALIKSVHAFEAVNFILGAISVSPQILLALAGDLAPPHKQGQAFSIVLAGLLLGILMARVLSGIVAEVGNISDVYWMSFGLQTLVGLLLWLSLPDYPSQNKDLSYSDILKSMIVYLFSEPVVVQACAIGGLASVVFSAFWTTQTFILGTIFGYNSLEIGLFALVGVLGVLTTPFIGRFVDTLVPWYGALLGLWTTILSQVVFIAAAGRTQFAVAFTSFAIDVGVQLEQVGNNTSLFTLKPTARARCQSLYLLSVFVGQLVGTSAGGRIYLEHGGYVSSGGFCLGMLGVALIFLVARGPHCPPSRWIGWEGGWSWRKEPPIVDSEKESHELSERAP